MSCIFGLDNVKRSGIAKQYTNKQQHMELAKIHVYTSCQHAHTYKLKWRIWRVSQCQKSILKPLFFVVLYEDSKFHIFEDIWDNMLN